jgi:hypothetical protein
MSPVLSNDPTLVETPGLRGNEPSIADGVFHHDESASSSRELQKGGGGGGGYTGKGGNTVALPSCNEECGNYMCAQVAGRTGCCFSSDNTRFSPMVGPYCYKWCSDVVTKYIATIYERVPCPNPTASPSNNPVTVANTNLAKAEKAKADAKASVDNFKAQAGDVFTQIRDTVTNLGNMKITVSSAKLNIDAKNFNCYNSKLITLNVCVGLVYGGQTPSSCFSVSVGPGSLKSEMFTNISNQIKSWIFSTLKLQDIVNVINKIPGASIKLP